MPSQINYVLLTQTYTSFYWPICDSM